MRGNPLIYKQIEKVNYPNSFEEWIIDFLYFRALKISYKN